MDTPVDPDNFNRLFRSLCERAGVRPIRLHDLRRTCVSLLLALGKRPRVVRQIAGHSAIDMTINVYGHVNLDAQRTALGRLDSLLADASDTADQSQNPEILGPAEDGCPDVDEAYEDEDRRCCQCVLSIPLRAHRRSAFVLVKCGAPGRIRTCDPRIRSPPLYPAELRAPGPNPRSQPRSDAIHSSTSSAERGIAAERLR